MQKPFAAMQLPIFAVPMTGKFTCSVLMRMLATQVNVVEQHRSFLHFLTNVCAIVGGVFTVAGILDSTVYHGHRLIRKKKELGKYG